MDLSVSEAEDTFQVVDKGTERGKRKLVSNCGYTYTFKRQYKCGDIVWRCSVRGKNVTCPVTVKQKETHFECSHTSHIHTSKPGILTSVKIKAQVQSA